MMSLTIRLTGTAAPRLVFGCDCAACQRARVDARYRRRPAARWCALTMRSRCSTPGWRIWRNASPLAASSRFY